MNSLQYAKWTRYGGIGAAAAALIAVIAVSILRPDRKTDPEDKFVQNVTQHPFSQADLQTREALRRQWRSFPPETRRRIFEKIARVRLEAVRREMEKLPPEQRAQRIREAVQKMRERRKTLAPEQRRRLRERLRNPEAREMIANVMQFYHQELTARERAELDPLVQEWLWQMEQLGQGP